MNRRWRRNERGQLHVVEAIIVGVLVFTILFVTSTFRLPTSPGTFQQAELASIAHDTLVALQAKPPGIGADCHEPAPCPFDSELERMLSRALGYQGMIYDATHAPNTDEVVEYLEQALPPGTRYILIISNGVSPLTIYPKNVVPPGLEVSVGHLFMTFRWDRYATKVDDSMLIRIGETTGFVTASVASIHDPLNRTQNEEGDPLVAAFSDASGLMTVPSNTLYGTYEIQTTAPRTAYFTVVPPGIFGAGSSILTGDRDNSTTIRTKGLFGVLAAYNNTASPGVLDPTDEIYLDLDGSLGVSVGDLRLSRVTFCRGAPAWGIPCAGGTYVETGDKDVGVPLLSLGAVTIRAATTGSSATELEEGDALYLDTNSDGSVSSNDRRMSRFSVFPIGSLVQAGEPDVGQALAGFTSLTVVWGDLDDDSNVDIGEPIYLDLDGHGQSGGLEALDLHLSPKGSPTARYVYDIRLVAWYGV